MTIQPTDARQIGGVVPELRGNAHTSVAVYSLGSQTTDTADTGTTDAGALDWVAEHGDAIREILRTQGAIMLRGFPVEVEVFDRVIALVGGQALEYTERSTPRHTVAGNIYTSTDYPANQSIPMHNESSYSDSWPTNLFFFCHTPSATGGATPLADSRAVLRLLPPEVRDRFAGGVTYTRTFREGLGLSWQEAFQTEERSAVEDYCRAHGHEFEWTDEGLRTRHRRPSTQLEPHTGEDVWFNQANLFHVSSLGPELAEVLTSAYGEQGLPRHALFGDGGAISEDDLAAVARVYEEVSLALPWQAGDIIIINNMLMAHGRQPYTGERKILVAMT